MSQTTHRTPFKVLSARNFTAVAISGCIACIAALIESSAAYAKEYRVNTQADFSELNNIDFEPGDIILLKAGATSRFAEKYRRMINSSIPVENCILAKRWPN